MDRVLQIVAELLGAPVPEGFLAEHRARTFRAFATELAPVAGVAGAARLAADPLLRGLERPAR